MEILLSRKSSLLDGKIKASFSTHLPFSDSDASKSLLPVSTVVSFKLRVPFVEISAMWTSFWTIQTLFRSSDFYQAKITPKLNWVFWVCLPTFLLIRTSGFFVENCTNQTKLFRSTNNDNCICTHSARSWMKKNKFKIKRIHMAARSNLNGLKRLGSHP